MASKPLKATIKALSASAHSGGFGWRSAWARCSCLAANQGAGETELGETSASGAVCEPGPYILLRIIILKQT